LTGIAIDIPTALTPAESAAIESLARGKRVYECGSLLGYSTVLMARVARSVLSIDPHAGYGEDTWKPFLANLDSYGVRHKVVAVRARAEELLPLLTGADLAFLDLTGEGPLMEQCLRLAWRLCPKVAVHDYGRGSCGGGTLAIDEFIERLGLSGLHVIRVDTLIVLRRRDDR
jgi:predicted O-methyltransferase YrrM